MTARALCLNCQAIRTSAYLMVCPVCVKPMIPAPKVPLAGHATNAVWAVKDWSATHHRELRLTATVGALAGGVGALAVVVFTAFGG